MRKVDKNFFKNRKKFLAKMQKISLKNRKKFVGKIEKNFL